MTWPDSCRGWKSRQGWSNILRIAIVASAFPRLPSNSRDDGAQCATHPRKKRARSIALTARGGCYGDNQAHIHMSADRAQQPPPRRYNFPGIPSCRLPLSSGDDQECDPDLSGGWPPLHRGCARNGGPHLDMNHPLYCQRHPLVRTSLENRVEKIRLTCSNFDRIPMLLVNRSKVHYVTFIGEGKEGEREKKGEEERERANSMID